MNRARRALPGALAVLVCVTLFHLSDVSATDRETDLAKEGLSFVSHDLPEAVSNQKVRPVQPELNHIQRWISAVGASVGALDLRGLGYDGDACVTDPRDDALRVFSTPGSGGTAFPTFELKPTPLPYDRTMAPIGCVPADVDQDGRTDIVAYYWGRSPVIFHNDLPAGHAPSASGFTPTELVSPMAVWNTTALNVVDIDGDGNLDILVGNYFPDGARVLDPSAGSDDLMAMQHSMGNARNAGPNRLFLGTKSAPSGPLRFRDASNRIPKDSATSWTLAFGAQDLSGDILPEIYVANDFGPDQLLVNHSTPGSIDLRPVQGQRDLTTAKSKVLGHDSFKGMGVVFSYEEDSPLPRIFVSNITSPWALQESNLAFYPDGEGASLLEGKLPYQDRSSAVGIAHSGWSWDIKTIDPRNSGQDSLLQATGFVQGTANLWPRLQEMAMGNDQILSQPWAWPNMGPEDDLSGHEPARLWMPVGDRFVDAGAAVPFSPNDVTRGFSVADINGDAQSDFLVAGQWGPSRVFLNTSDMLAPGVELRIQKDAEYGASPVIGAKVTMTCPDGTSRRAQLYPANGHSGVSGNSLHLALPAPGCAAVISWRDADGVHNQPVALRAGTQTVKVSP